MVVMNRNKLTIKERIAAVEVLKGKDPISAVATAGYGSPESHYGNVGMQIAQTVVNPFEKRQKYFDRALDIISKAIELEPDEPMTWSERLKAIEIGYKMMSNPNGEQHTHNTLILGDIKAMDEGTLLRTLQQLRGRSSAAPQEGVSEEAPLE